jgi:hypothetical protein
VADLKRRHKPRRKIPAPRSRTLLICAAVAALLFLLGSIIAAQVSRDAAQTETSIVEDQRDATAAQAVEAARPVLDLCGDQSPVGEALRTDPRNPCGLAQQVQAAPVPGPEGPRGAAGPGPTPEQVSRAVADFLIENPPPAGRPPSPAEVAAAVAAYLTEHPPSPGRAPTAGEIASAVQTYYTANPPPAGRDGEDGRAPTPEEIQAAVAEYLAANPPPAGPIGATGGPGAQGVGVQDIRTEQTGTDCVLVFVLHDPATETTSERSIPVPAGMCPATPVIPELKPGGGPP